MKVAVYVYPGSKRSELVAHSMVEGIRRAGDQPDLRHRLSYRAPDTEVAIFYGLMKEILGGYKAAGKKAIYVDLGYWGRHEGGRRAGYHKVAINSRHPTDYFQRRVHVPDRFNRFGVPILPWRTKGDHVLVVGMSAKAAAAEGYGPQEWETKVIRQLNAITKRSVWYRPKPNWHDASPIQGSSFVRGTDGDATETVLRNCHAVVTHHSNVAIDAVLAGVPVFSWDGAGKLMSCQNLDMIESPRLYAGREQFAYDLAYTQWNVAEMQAGLAWRYLREEGLVVS